MEIMFEGTVATRKIAWIPSGQIPKESIEKSEHFTDSKEFVDPQCHPFANVYLMEVEGHHCRGRDPQ